MREKVKQYSLSTGTTDLYIIFYELGLKWLNKDGVLSYIAPNSWLKNSSQKSMREKLVTDNNIKEIIDFGIVNVFPKISTYTCITVLDKKHNDEIIFSKMDDITQPDFIVKIPYSFLNENKGKPFSFVSDSDYAFLKKKTSLRKLDDIAKVQNGIATLGDKYFIVNDGMEIEEEYVAPIVKASTFKGSEYQKIIFPYFKKDNRYVGIGEDVLDTVPFLKAYLFSEKENLSKRSLDKNSLWFWYGRSQAIQETDKRKLVFSPIISPTQKNIKSYIVPSGTLVYSGLFITERPDDLSLEEIQKIIETEEFMKYVSLLGKDMSGKYKSVNSNIVKNYPV